MASLPQPCILGHSDALIETLSTYITPEDAPTKIDSVCGRCFEHNRNLIFGLMFKDEQYGRSRAIRIEKTTANQMVNLLSRSKQRRRKQIYDERHGLVS
jgi:hypothetical protein